MDYYPRWCVCLLPVLLMLLVLLQPLTGFGHEVPERVQLRLFIKVEGNALVVLLRVPLEALRDVDFPQQGPGYLDIAKVDAALEEAVNLWLIDEIRLYQEGIQLPRGQLRRARISLPADRSFRSYDSALQHLLAPPLADDTRLYWRQALVDVQLEYALNEAAKEFSWAPNLAHLGQRTRSLLTFITATNEEYLFEYEGNPGLVRLDPESYQVMLEFLRSGISHLLTGIDHSLFLLGLALPMARFWPLIGVITAFTVGHTVTLVSAALGYVPAWIWFSALVETLIALSILFVAIQNILAKRIKVRWVIALLFGLVHGYGFAFQFQESLQLAGSHLLLALLAFNIGVEVGQVILLVAILVSFRFALRVVSRPHWLVILVSALVIHIAWHWLLERGAILAAYFPGWL